MTRVLTGKQRKFCECIVRGMTGIDSYMTAYDSNNKNVANVESTKLLKRDDITAYIQELYKPIKNHNENMLISERQQQIDFIKSRIQECIKKDDEQSLIRWNEQLNRIYALYKETETEQKNDTKVNNLDTGTLIKLADIS